MRKTRIAGSAVLAVATCLLPLPGIAGPYAYPEKGQSAEQQAKDSSECSAWAKQQKAADPEAASGDGKGAARGAAVGAIGGHPLRGAIVGKLRERHQEAEAQKASGSDYDRAFSACMAGRGYAVR